MNKIKSMLNYNFFNVVGNNPVVSIMATADNPMIAIIGSKLVKVDKFVNPSLTITGLTNGKAKLGELVILEAVLANEYPDFIKKATIKWTVVDKGVEKTCWTDGKKIIFGTGVINCVINVTAKLSLIYSIDNQDITLYCDSALNVQVGEVDPPKPPDPPTPPDVPVILTGLAKDVSTWAVALVPSDARAKSIRALANSFKLISTGIGSDPTLMNLKDVLVTTKSKNNGAIIAVSVNPEVWDAWGTALQDRLFSMYTNGEMKKVEDIKKIWWDISNGLWNTK